MTYQRKTGTKPACVTESSYLQPAAESRLAYILPMTPIPMIPTWKPFMFADMLAIQLVKQHDRVFHESCTKHHCQARSSSLDFVKAKCLQNRNTVKVDKVDVDVVMLLWF
jgi:hypothetical protein